MFSVKNGNTSPKPASFFNAARGICLPARINMHFKKKVEWAKVLHSDLKQNNKIVFLPPENDKLMNQKARDLFKILLIYILAMVLGIAATFVFPAENALYKVAIADFVATVVVFIFSMVYKNSSVYDPYWSVVPIFIILYWIINSGSLLELEPLKLILAGLIIIWGMRLTVNWLLRWNNLEDEDWRYKDIQKKTGKFYWPVSFVGIHLMPTIWVFMGMVPVYYAIYSPMALTQFISVFAISITVFAIWLEATADNQLRHHLITRTNKNERMKKGVWAIIAYPNYVGEMLFWWGLYLFALAFNLNSWWTIFGPLSITFLFIFISIPLMKKRLANKK